MVLVMLTRAMCASATRARKWEAYLVHARHCYEDSQSEDISAQNRVSLAMNAGELIFKAL